MIADQNIDILCLTESWLDEAGDQTIIEMLTPPGYSTKSFPSKGRRGGGIAFVFNNDLKQIDTSNDIMPTPHESFEAAFFNFTSGPLSVFILCVYRPPKLSLSKFIDEFHGLIFNLRAKKFTFIIVGDFNINFENQNQSSTRQIKALLEEHDLIQLINVPTHRSKSILDWLIVPDEQTFIKNFDVCDMAISDHHAIFLELETDRPERPKRTVKSRKLKQVNHDVFRNDVEQELLLHCHKNITAEDLTNILRQILDQHAPEKTRTVSDRPTSPWFSDNIKEAKTMRRKAERKWRKSGLEIDRQLFINARKEANNTTMKNKRDYFLDKFSNVKSCKDLFKMSNQLLGKDKKKTLPKGNTKILCQQFMEFFENKISAIRTNLENEQQISPKFSNFQGTLFEQFSNVPESDIRKIICNSSSKSCCLDPVPTDMLKNILDVILPYITNIINHSLQTGTVPGCFKQAIVKPLIKKPTLDSNALKNFRPVSNLPFLSKILERTVLSQILKHIQSNDLSEKFQSAYKANHSTETALLKVSSDLLNEIDNKKVCLLILLDLSAAFDTIDHDILLKRLECTFGLTGTVLDWFDSYLRGRFQSVNIENDFSDQKPLSHGVPQGSVLGPVIFTLYTQPLVEILNVYNMKYHLYADDTQIYCSCNIDELPRLINTMERCVEELKIWMSSNKLKLNEEKTEFMLIGNPKVLQQIPSFQLRINGHDITCADKVKNLGIILDHDLSMKSQINHICKSMYFQMRNISHVRQYLTYNVTKTLMTSLVLSKMDYCNSLYASLPNNIISRLQMVQNNAARIIAKKKKRDNISHVIKDLHWLPVKDRIRYKIALFCYKYVNKTAPSYIADFLNFRRPSRTLRSSDDESLLIKTFPNYKTFGERSFSYIGPVIWNDLPKQIRQSENIDTFKSFLKNHLFRNAYLL